MTLEPVYGLHPTITCSYDSTTAIGRVTFYVCIWCREIKRFDPSEELCPNYRIPDPEDFIRMGVGIERHLSREAKHG